MSFFTLVLDVASKIHTHFQTWRRLQDATYMFTKTEITPSLLRLERQQKDFLKFILNSQFMGVFLIHLEPIEEYALTPRGSPENYTWFQSIPVFRPKRYKNPSLWGGTYLYGLYKGVRPGYWLSKRWRPEGRWSIQILALSPSALLKLIFRFYFSIQRYHLSYLCIKFRYYVKPFDEFMEIHLIAATDSTFQYSPYDKFSPLPARIQNRMVAT